MANRRGGRHLSVAHRAAISASLKKKSRSTGGGKKNPNPDANKAFARARSRHENQRILTGRAKYHSAKTLPKEKAKLKITQAALDAAEKKRNAQTRRRMSGSFAKSKIKR